MPVTDFWGFCQKLYAEPGIEALCLSLQDQQQVNVLILLWCAWLDAGNENLTDDTLRSGYRHIAPMNDSALVPLRQARRFIKTESTLSADVIEQVRRHILAAELAIEESLLRKLEGLPMTDPVASSSAATCRPLDRLVVHLGLQSDEWLPLLRAAAANIYPSC